MKLKIFKIELIAFRMIFKYLPMGFIYAPFRTSVSVLCTTLEKLGVSLWMKHTYSGLSWNLTSRISAYRIISQKAFHCASCFLLPALLFLSTLPPPSLDPFTSQLGQAETLQASTHFSFFGQALFCPRAISVTAFLPGKVSFTFQNSFQMLPLPGSPPFFPLSSKPRQCVSNAS